MTFSLILSYTYGTFFIETTSLWLIYKSIKALEIKTSMVFNLAFANNAILSCFFFFFWTIYLYFLIRAVFTQIFIATAELVIPTRMPTNDLKAEFETNPTIADYL